jgi:glutathione S-transferase
MEWLNFVSSEIHKQFGPFFNPRITPEWKACQTETLGRRFDYLSERLNGRLCLLGERFSVADAYLFTSLGWCDYAGLDLGRWPGLQAYRARVGERPAVREALRAEGLAD